MSASARQTDGRVPSTDLHARVRARLAVWHQRLAFADTALRSEMTRPYVQRRENLMHFLYRERIVATTVIDELRVLADSDSSAS